jgi:hypothetical protein
MTIPPDDTPENPSVSGSFILTDDPFPDQAHADFFKWVGVCIKEWAGIEARLYEILEFVVRARPQHVSIIFYRTPNFEARLSLVSELVRTILPQRAQKDGGHDHKDVKTWNKLVKDTKELMPTRNLLAHAPVSYILETHVKIEKGGAWKKAGESSGMEIRTSREERLRNNADKFIKDENLESHFKKVRAISDRWDGFLSLLESSYSQESSPS